MYQKDSVTSNSWSSILSRYLLTGVFTIVVELKCFKFIIYIKLKTAGKFSHTHTNFILFVMYRYGNKNYKELTKNLKQSLYL